MKTSPRSARWSWTRGKIVARYRNQFHRLFVAGSDADEVTAERNTSWGHKRKALFPLCITFHPAKYQLFVRNEQWQQNLVFECFISLLRA